MRATTVNSTFAIPQEILDPNYRSPTFRIKSGNPPPSTSSSTSSSSKSHSSTSLVSTDRNQDEMHLEQSKRTLDGGTTANSINDPGIAAGSCSEEQQAIQSTVPTLPSSSSPVPPPSFQFNFTSERFKAVVQASMVEKGSSFVVLEDPGSTSATHGPTRVGDSDPEMVLFKADNDGDDDDNDDDEGEGFNISPDKSRKFKGSC
ncbi:hypothetical protein BGX28_003147 [Mortierella sp. GBA30]|nr:hypothetical protein BGX28_003147 [Mortierella sp. GBA30]